jgi:hypothetical protein
MQLERIVSGGQTGVDRGALDAAIMLDVPHGGWCPLGRLAEDGRIPSAYQLRETPSPEYPVRTEQNVIDSDGTLILYRHRLFGGTELTRRLCRKHRRPVISVDLNADGDQDIQRVRQWLQGDEIRVLNVAGPRESSSPGIARETKQFLCRVLANVDEAS